MKNIFSKIHIKKIQNFIKKNMKKWLWSTLYFFIFNHAKKLLRIYFLKHIFYFIYLGLHSYIKWKICLRANIFSKKIYRLFSFHQTKWVYGATFFYFFSTLFFTLYKSLSKKIRKKSILKNSKFHKLFFGKLVRTKLDFFLLFLKKLLGLIFSQTYYSFYTWV